MKRIALAIALSLSTAAFATGTPPVAPVSAQANAGASAQALGVGISSASSYNSLFGYTSGYAVGNANSAQGGTGFGTALSAPTQTVNVGGVPAQQTVTHNGRSYVENVPNVYAPNIYPTAPCMGSSSAGAGWLGFGMSGGTSWVDRECQLMEASRNAPTPADRIYVWCKSESAKGAPSCAGLSPEPVAATPGVPVERERRADATVKTGDPRTWGSY